MLSWSSLADYESCPEKFRLRKIENAPQAPSWSALGGSAVHTVTEALDHLDFGVDSTHPVTFDAALDEQVAQAETREDCPPRADWHRAGRPSKANPNKEDEAWWRENGPHFVMNWRNWLQRSPLTIATLPDGTPAIEISVTGTVGGVPVRGYIDRVMTDSKSGALLALDLKSGARTPTQSGQLKTYASLLFQTLGMVTDWGCYFMAREGLATPPAPLSDRAALNHEYATAWKGIQAGIFLPNRGPLCGSCSVKRWCVFGGDADPRFAPYSNAA